MEPMPIRTALTYIQTFLNCKVTRSSQHTSAFGSNTCMHNIMVSVIHLNACLVISDVPLTICLTRLFQ